MKTYETILLVTNPFPACSGSPPQCSTFSSITVISLPVKGWGKCLTYWYQYQPPRHYSLMRERIWWQKPETLCLLQNLGATNEISSGLYWTMIGLIILMWKCEWVLQLHSSKYHKFPSLHTTLSQRWGGGICSNIQFVWTIRPHPKIKLRKCSWHS